MGRLIKKIPFTLQRATGKGVWNSSGEYIGPPRIDVNIKCNIQPYKSGNVQSTLPEGIRSSDAVIVYSKDLIKTADQFSEILADTCNIDGNEYVALMLENWARNGLRLDHYKAVFVRSDKVKNGGI